MKKTEFEKVGNSLKPLLKKGIEKKVFSAVATGLYLNRNKEEKRLLYTQGVTKNDDQGILVNRETLFDLASLTKPLCTVLSILCLIEKGSLDWKSSLGTLVSGQIPTEYKNITLDELLSHSAGLMAYKPFYKNFSPTTGKDNQQKLIQKLFDEKLAYTPGSTCLYSDLGYILLGEIIESVSNTQLDIFFKEEVAIPLGLENKIFFRRLGTNLPVETQNTVATEACPWRHKTLQGEVHDEHCWLMNGVAGQAGLFGTVEGVLSIVEAVLDIWKGRMNFKGFSRELLEKTLTRKYINQTWCLGFDTPSSTGSTSGRYFSKKSVGHLGYTGTSFWIDPVKDLAVVLLTNRVYPSRKNEQIRAFRPLFHDTVMEAITGQHYR